MYQFFNRTSYLALVTGALLFSCQGSDKGEPDKISTSDNANVQGMFDDMAKVTEDALNKNNAGTGARLSSPGTPISCATVEKTILATDSTKFTINFPSGGTCNDYKIRTGTITAVLDGASYNTPGSILTIETTDYTVFGTKIEGRKVVKCLSNFSNNPVHEIVVSDISLTSSGHAKITYPNGQTAVWKSKRKRSLISGGGDGDIFDNIYDISASDAGNQVASGVNREGNSYTVNIINALRVNFSCFANNTARYPTQGTLMVTPAGKQPMSIDYGSGACDNKVKITYLGKTYDVTLSY
jgi:hypothetical protein